MREATAAKQVPETPGPKYKIPIRDFLPMAECIVKSRKPLITVPSSFVSTIDRAIRLRSTYSSQVQLQGLSTDLDADDAHDYFVGVLRNVREVLNPRFPSTDETQGPQSPQTEDILRGFQLLSVEEPSEEFLNAPDIEQPQKAKGDNASYEAETGAPDRVAALLAWHVLLTEAQNVRRQIQSIWQGYLNDTFDMTAAALATNIGMQTIGNLSDQLSTFLDADDVTELAKSSFVDVVVWETDYSVEEATEMVDTGHFDKNLLSFYNSTFVYALDMIKDLVKHTQDRLARLKPPEAPCNSPEEQIAKEDREALYDFWIEGVLFLHYNIEKAGKSRFAVEDEFLRILRKTNQTNEVSFEMAFVSQIFLDVRRLLGEETMERKTLCCITEMRCRLEIFVKRFDQSPTPEFIDRLRPEIQNGINLLSCFVNDIVPEVKAHQIRHGGDVDGTDEPWRFFKRSPILCGISLFHARAEIYKLSVTCMKFTGITTCFHHLYNAMQQEGLLDKPWADMEAFEACFEEQDLFLGRKPKNSNEYHKRLLIQLGLPPLLLKKREKQSWRLGVTDQPRKNSAYLQAVKDMDKGAPVSNAYLRVHKQHGGFVDLTREELMEIASLSKYKFVSEEGQTIFGPRSVEEKQQLEKRALRPKSKHTARKDLWPSSHYLIRLTQTLTAEARELAFPYLEMHDVCYALRPSLIDRCKRVLEEQVLVPGALPIEQANDMLCHTLMLADWPGGDLVLKEAAAVIGELCSKLDGKIREKVQDIKSFSGPVPVPDVVPDSSMEWYMGSIRDSCWKEGWIGLTKVLDNVASYLINGSMRAAGR